MGVRYSDIMNISYDSDEWVFLFKVRLIHYGCEFCTMNYFAL